MLKHIVMYMFRVLVVFLLCPAFGVSAQVDFKTYDQKAKEISQLEDVNEIKFQLTELAKSFKSFVRVRGASEAENGGEYIKAVKSSDSKYTVLYFNTYANNLLYRVDWFVLYGEPKNRKIFHSFIDNITYEAKREKPEIVLDLARRTEESIDFYPLTFSFRSDKKLYEEYLDIATVCMFEELLERESSKERLALNDSILDRMNLLWKNPEFFAHGFNGMKRISTLISEDKKVKVCTWNVLLPNSTNKFFGAAVANVKTGIKVQPFVDRTEKIRSVEKSVLTPKKWLGAIYYEIIEVKDKNRGTYYMLLGFKPNNEMTKKKVIETMLVVGNGQVRFGHSVLQTEKGLNKRAVFEYNAATNMLLKYDENKNRIVLDHLAPANSAYEGNYRLYGPDFSYDAYVWNKDKWVLKEDVDVYNPKKEEPANRE